MTHVIFHKNLWMDCASDLCHTLIAENQGLHNLLGQVYDAMPDAAPVKAMLVDEYAVMINQYGLPTNVSNLLSRASLNRLHRQQQFLVQQELLAHQLYIQQQQLQMQQDQHILLMQQQLQRQRLLQQQQQSAFMVQVSMNASQPHQQEKPVEPLEAKPESTPAVVPAKAASEPARPTEHVVTSFPPANNVRKLSAHQLRVRYEQSRQFERMIRQDQADKETEAVRKRVQQMSQSSPLVKKRVKVIVTPMTPVCFDEPPTPMTPLSPFTPFTPMTELSEMTL
jgi:hypothetical protein